MKTVGCEILDAAGLHPDGWCGPDVRLRIGARAAALSLRISVWTPEQAGAGPIEFKATVGRRRLFRKPHVFRAVAGQPAPLTVPVEAKPGDEISLAITTRHRVRKTNQDRRDLSFMMQEVTLGRASR